MSSSKFFRNTEKAIKRYNRYLQQVEREREKEEKRQIRIERDRIKQEETEHNPVTTRNFQQNQRIEIFSNDNWRCCACGSEYNLRADHIVPWAKGGMSLVRNGQTLCFDCNANKSAKSQEEWMKTKYFLFLPHYADRNMRSSPSNVKLKDVKKKELKDEILDFKQESELGLDAEQSVELSEEPKEFFLAFLYFILICLLIFMLFLM